jgi:transposase-like protein
MPSGQWPPAEKRRIVELMLRAGALKAVLPADR